MFDEFQNLPVVVLEPTASQDMTAAYERMWRVLDNGKALPKFVEKTDRGFTIVQQTYEVRGVLQMSLLLRLLNALQGRLRPCWVPTYMHDMEPVGENSGALRIRHCDMSKHAVVWDRSYVRIEKLNGDYSYRRIDSATEVDTDYEDVVFVDGLPTTFDQIRRISFMPMMRLDQDTVEIKHLTDVQGVANVTLTFRSTYPWPEPAEKVSIDINYTGTFADDVGETFDFTLDVPAEMEGLANIRAYLMAGAWDDRGTVSGNVRTITPGYYPGYITHYYGPQYLVGNDGEPLTGYVVNTLAGGCSYSIVIRWVGEVV